MKVEKGVRGTETIDKALYDELIFRNLPRHMSISASAIFRM